MSAELRGVARLKLDPSNLEDFKRMAGEVLGIMRAQDSGTLQYDLYFNEDETECVFLEHFKDSDALVDHNNHLGDLLWKMLGMGTVSAEIFGQPSDEVMAMLTDTPVRIYTQFLSL